MPAASRLSDYDRQDTSAQTLFRSERRMRDSVEFVRVIWDEIDRSLREEGSKRRSLPVLEPMLGL